MNEARLRLLLMRTFSDVAAAQSASLVALGDALGFYRALAERAMTATELAEATQCEARLVTEWLRNQLAADYVSLHDDHYSLSDEQHLVFASDEAPVAMSGAFALAAALAGRRDALAATFRGAAMPASADVSDAIARQSRAKYAAAIDAWLPAEARERLEAGGRVAEIGCGSGSLLDALAARFPKARFTGIDALAQARESGRVSVRAGDASTVALQAYDVVLSVEALHDMADPATVLRAVRSAAGAHGLFVAIEPVADDPVAARYLSSLSALHCLPSGGRLGAAATAAEYEELFRHAGFGAVRRAAQMMTSCTWLLSAGNG
jgi:ubiquinone/menaquinone biosynthesis C-methylase UbiE